MKTAFSFFFFFPWLFFAAWAEEGFAYGDYMQTLTRNVHARRLHGRIAFEEKTSSLTNKPPRSSHSSLPGPQRGQRLSLPFLSLVSFPLLLSRILAVESSSPPLHLPIPSVILPHSPRLSPAFLLSSSSSSIFSSVLQLRSEELAAAQCDADSEASRGVQLSQKTRFDPLPLLSEQLSSHNGQFLCTSVCVHVCVRVCSLPHQSNG